MGIDVSGKVAVVIGGSRGLGKAIALGLAKAGADVVPASRSTNRNTEVVREIVGMGRNSCTVEVDATRREMVQKLRDTVLERFGRIDVLVHSAGIGVRKPFLEVTEEEWDAVLQVNLKSAFVCSQVFGSAMVKQGAGTIINVASLGSFVGLGGSAPYCASKGGLLMLTRVLAVEWADKGVRVNAVVPGYFATDLTRPILQDERVFSMIVSRTPMRRVASPDEVAGAVVYLASDAARFVTGTAIAVDGGFLSYGIGL